MLKMQPIAFLVEAHNQYKVRFQTEQGEVEYLFTMDETGAIPVLLSEDEYLKATYGDPAADLLLRSICSFHACRGFSYSKCNVVPQPKRFADSA